MRVCRTDHLHSIPTNVTMLLLVSSMKWRQESSSDCTHHHIVSHLNVVLYGSDTSSLLGLAQCCYMCIAHNSTSTSPVLPPCSLDTCCSLFQDNPIPALPSRTLRFVGHDHFYWSHSLHLCIVHQEMDSPYDQFRKETIHIVPYLAQQGMVDSDVQGRNESSSP